VRSQAGAWEQEGMDKWHRPPACDHRLEAGATKAFFQDKVRFMAGTEARPTENRKQRRLKPAATKAKLIAES